jgi:hypothetical protein
MQKQFRFVHLCHNLVDIVEGEVRTAVEKDKSAGVKKFEGGLKIETK